MLLLLFFGSWQNLIYDLSCTIWAEMKKKKAGYAPACDLEGRRVSNKRLISLARFYCTQQEWSSFSFVISYLPLLTLKLPNGTYIFKNL